MKTALIFSILLLLGTSMCAHNYDNISIAKLKEELVSAKATRNLEKVIDIAQALNQRFYDATSQKTELALMQRSQTWHNTKITLLVLAGLVATGLCPQLEPDNEVDFGLRQFAIVCLWFFGIGLTDYKNYTLSNAFDGEKHWLEYELKTADWLNLL